LSRRVTREVKPLPNTDAELSELAIDPPSTLYLRRRLPEAVTNDLEIS